jgi:hypothetical protein
VYKRKKKKVNFVSFNSSRMLAVSSGKQMSCEVLGFLRVVVEIFPLLRCYEALVSQFVIDLSGQCTLPVLKGLVGPL